MLVCELAESRGCGEIEGEGEIYTETALFERGEERDVRYLRQPFLRANTLACMALRWGV